MSKCGTSFLLIYTDVDIPHGPNDTPISHRVNELTKEQIKLLRQNIKEARYFILFFAIYRFHVLPDDEDITSLDTHEPT